MKFFGSTRRRKSRETMEELERRAKAGDLLSSRGESLWTVYRRRFRKHTLGKIGLLILALLYATAILADFMSPFDMRWTDKTKSFHPPTRIYFTYRDGGKTVFRPFVYEKYVINIPRKKYGIMPSRAIRVITIETRPGMIESRIIALEKTPAERSNTILKGVARYYGLSENHPGLIELTGVIAGLEKNPASDVQVKLRLGTRLQGGREAPMDLIVAKGNKNFLGFFFQGVPYKFLGLFKTHTHLFGSPTGGFFLFGADQYGRDVLSRLIHGSRVSLSVGLLGALITFTLGLVIGGIAGYFGGAVDTVLMRICEVLLSYPSLYLLFALRATFPPGLTSVQVYLLIVLILSFIGWSKLARIIRGLVLSLKNEEYVLSAKSMGLSHMKIILKHVLPNTLSFVIIQATLTIPGYILGESALSLLGLGITEPQSSWGLMLAVARNYRVVQTFPWILIPGVAIFIAIMAWNFFGDGIRDAVDPRSRQ